MTKRKILVVDDDLDLRQGLVDQIEPYNEFDVIVGEKACDAIRLVADNQPDLLILDVGLPDMDGREAVKIMRREGFNNPILLLTGHDTDSDEILGLESGANDYVTKPFRFSVLLARMRALLRQHEQSESASFTVGPYVFQPSAKTMEEPDGQKIRLTEKETAILKFLYRKGSSTTSRDILLKEVWGYNAQVTTHTLETHIYRLRQKIEKDPSNAQLLVTEEGGYRLVP